MDRIERTLAFLNERFDGSAYFALHGDERAYRVEHSLRVANLGRQIAEAEGFDAEAMTIACLLHDVGYARDIPGGWTDADVQNHARFSAAMARPFIEALGFPAPLAQEMLFGIAIHCDGKADFPGEETPFAASVSDADNIDRFDAYRLYDNMQRVSFGSLPLREKLDYCEARVTRQTRFCALLRQQLAGAPLDTPAPPCGTATAARLWLDRLDFSVAYHARLLAQLQSTVPPNLAGRTFVSTGMPRASKPESVTR